MTTTEIKKRLKGLPGWRYNAPKRCIWTEIQCKGFTDAVRLIGKIALLAEKADHHPDLHLTRYRRLKIVLTTHAAGAVTVRDLKLAKKVNVHKGAFMKKVLILISAILVSTAAYAEMPEGWTPPKASAELRRLKGLAGDWKVTEKTAEGSKTTTIRYQVTSGGTAVTETIDPGTPHEMLTVYHDKAGKLAMNHFCMLGNQPEMELRNSTDNRMDLQESAASKTLLDGQQRMSSLVIEQTAPDTLVETWGGTNADGTLGQPMVFNLKKV